MILPLYKRGWSSHAWATLPFKTSQISFFSLTFRRTKTLISIALIFSVHEAQAYKFLQNLGSHCTDEVPNSAAISFIIYSQTVSFLTLFILKTCHCSLGNTPQKWFCNVLPVETFPPRQIFTLNPLTHEFRVIGDLLGAYARVH